MNKLKKRCNAFAFTHIRTQAAIPTEQFTTLKYLRRQCVKSVKSQWQFRVLNMRHNSWFPRCCFEVIKIIFVLSDVNELKDMIISCDSKH
jgi:hypothetical protein